MHLPNKKEINLALNSFTKSERIVFFSLTAIFVISTLTVLNIVNNKFLVEVPALGGSLTEGVAGESPRFINPLLATSDADRDLAALIYSGLLRVSSNGDYIGDLAENFKISDDGLSYAFKIRQGAVWHDGQPVTSDDIEFTIQKARDPSIKSYKRPSFEGVSLEKLDDKNIVLKLKQPYSPFLEALTLGILPKHIWNDVSPDAFPYSKWNTSPIGSGPYKIKRISGVNTPEYYDLTPFKYFTLNQPKIEKLKIRFYKNEEELLVAYRSGEVDAINTIPPQTAKTMEDKKIPITRVTLPRIFAVFFNQNNSKILADKSVRIALNTALDKKGIVENVLLGYGQIINGPTLTVKDEGGKEDVDRSEVAKKILEKGGWKFDEKKKNWTKGNKKSTLVLSLDLSTADIPELKSVAELIKKDWEKIGIKTTMKIFEIGDLNQNVIRPRKYDAIFFGEVVGRNPDLFSFWHSSQRNDPGLNIAMYTSGKADKILEEIRVENDTSKRLKKYADLQKEIDNDTPAAFVYSPQFLYALPSKVLGAKIDMVTVPSDRFNNIHKWYIDTEKIWKIFANN